MLTKDQAMKLLNEQADYANSIRTSARYHTNYWTKLSDAMRLGAYLVYRLNESQYRTALHAAGLDRTEIKDEPDKKVVRGCDGDGYLEVNVHGDDGIRGSEA